MFLKGDRRAEFRWKYYSYNEAENPGNMKCDCVEFSVFVCLDLLWSSHTGHAHICEDAGPGFNSLNWLQVCQHISFDMVSHLGPDFSKALKQIKIH